MYILVAELKNTSFMYLQTLYEMLNCNEATFQILFLSRKRFKEITNNRPKKPNECG